MYPSQQATIATPHPELSFEFNLGAGDPPTPEVLAAEFIQIIGWWLTGDELNAVRAKNTTPEYAGCCATHDYCDANMALLTAYLNVSDREGEDGAAAELLTDSGVALCNAAWAIARSKEFRP